MIHPSISGLTPKLWIPDDIHKGPGLDVPFCDILNSSEKKLQASNHLASSQVESGIVQGAGDGGWATAASCRADALPEGSSIVATGRRSYEELALMAMNQHSSASLHLHLSHAGLFEVSDGAQAYTLCRGTAELAMRAPRLLCCNCCNC